MSDLILHHYPQSPMSEKVRIVLGIKNLSWRSVIVPRIPPKPLLFPLTGGYRRVPVLQIGADIYCDTNRILRQIDKRHPEPALVPTGNRGMVWGVTQWTDGPLFQLMIQIVFAATADQMPAEFIRDRGLLYFGDENVIPRFKKDFTSNLSQLRGQLSWLDTRLGGNRDYFLGDSVSLPDGLIHYLLWMLRDRWDGADGFLEEFPHICSWLERMKAVGTGTATEMSAEDAWDAAQNANPDLSQREDPRDPQGLMPGDRVEITHTGGGHDAAVTGSLLRSDADIIAIHHRHDDLGDLVLHFPKVGYQVRKSGSPAYRRKLLATAIARWRPGR